MLLRPDILDADERARLRAALDAAGWQRRELADRFCLATCALDDPAIARLVDLAASVTGTPLRRHGHEWLRLAHGDYQLMKGDERPPIAHVELIADISAVATGEAEVFYSDGGVLAQQPGAVAIVERSASNFRWQRYLTCRVGAVVVQRLRLTLIP